jgi:hypothetical protein
MAVKVNAMVFSVYTFLNHLTCKTTHPVPLGLSVSACVAQFYEYCATPILFISPVVSFSSVCVLGGVGWTGA